MDIAFRASPREKIFLINLLFKETYAPFVRRENDRMLKALAEVNDWDIIHLNIKTVSLYGDLEQGTVGSIPDGNENKVCLFKKATYGLRQASGVWN